VKPHPLGVLAGASSAAYAHTAWQLLDTLYASWKDGLCSTDSVRQLATLEEAVVDALLEITRALRGLDGQEAAFLADLGQALVELQQLAAALVRTVTHPATGAELTFERCRASARQAADRLVGRGPPVTPSEAT
jgi:hypothetical protein